MKKVVTRGLMALAILYVVLAAAVYLVHGRLIFPAPQESHAPAPGYEAVTLETGDGLSLAAHWKAPEGDKPAVVHFHGNSGSLMSATAENQAFADAGFGVLLVEYRGYGGNPGAPSEAGFRQDGEAAMDFLKSRSITPDRTILKGHSIGTGTASYLASEHDVAALILVAPFTSMADRMAQALPIFPMRLMVRDVFDNRAKLAGLDMPVLVQHGTADTVIPHAHGKALADVAPRATLQSVSGEDHDLTFTAPVQRAQLEWLGTLGN